MCLQITVVPKLPRQVGPKRLSEASGLIFRKLKGREELSISRDPGCACSMLTEAAAFSDDTWDLDPAVLEPLSRGLALLAREAAGFSFVAIWAGDSVVGGSQISLAAFLEVIRKNEIRNAWQYSVE